jgi:hypothetical protein
MTIGLLFWILMILWLVLGSWAVWPAAGFTPGTAKPFGANLLLFVLLFLLGWAVFGFVIQGPGAPMHPY